MKRSRSKICRSAAAKHVHPLFLRCSQKHTECIKNFDFDFELLFYEK